MEIWKPIDDFEGLYEVSNLGRVRSLDRVVIDKGRPSRRQGRMMALTANGPLGYLGCGLWKEGKGYPRRVHCLVAQAFIGDRPDNLVVRHLDGNTSNNHATNLAYGTHTENAADTAIHGNTLLGSKNPCAKLSTEDVLAIRAMQGFASAQDVSERFGIHPDSVYRHWNRKTWQHLN